MLSSNSLPLHLLGRLATITYCEQTSLDVTSNYCCEPIDGVMATLVLCALSKMAIPPPGHTFEIFCDNMGVVSHGNNCYECLPERQVQVDLINLIRRNLSTLNSSVKYTHLYGHLDEALGFAELTLPQQLNVMADKLANESIQSHVQSGILYGSTYLLEPVWLWVGGQTMTSSVCTALYNQLGCQHGSVPLPEKKDC
jgi:hypothetical protein